VVYRPFLLGGVFQATGNRSPMEVPAKGHYMLQDLQRYARRYGVEFAHNPHFPINTLMLMRGAVGLQMREPDPHAGVRRCGLPRHLGRRPQHERPATVAGCCRKPASKPQFQGLTPPTRR
jgi:hypothetical protein